MTESATLPNFLLLVQADTMMLVCNKGMSDRSYTLLLEPSHVVDADTARPMHVSEFSNEKFSFVIRASVNETVTVVRTPALIFSMR
jgi:hypothetical protein